MTGEAHDGKLWGVATLRHRDLVDERTRLEHPADRIGDAGAGLGALLFVAAHARLARARRPGPALLWAASDHGACGCAVMRNEADLSGA
jgi:3-oxoacyl-[acyl-carrier-protein] synthase-1